MDQPSERVGTRILFEDERVRVWQDGAGPGETRPMHVHRLPYLTVVVAGDRAENIGADGSVLRRFDRLTPGEAHHVGADDLPLVHALRNTGSTDVAVVIVELLD